VSGLAGTVAVQAEPKSSVNWPSTTRPISRFSSSSLTLSQART
jgi:hypothetical protein